MKQLNDKIITWLKHHNIDKLSPDKQYLKIIEEVGELAKGLLYEKHNEIKDAIGDIYVALVGYCLQRKNDFNVDKEIPYYTYVRGLKHLLRYLSKREISDVDITQIISILDDLADIHNLTLYECVEHAYNEIKDRDIRIENGVAVK